MHECSGKELEAMDRELRTFGGGARGMYTFWLYLAGSVLLFSKISFNVLLGSLYKQLVNICALSFELLAHKN